MTTAAADGAKKRFLLVMLDECATSFCHYEGPTSATKSRLMSLQTLRKTIGYSRAHGFIPQFLLGNVPLPEEHEAELARIEHSRTIPMSHPKTYANSIVVINPGDYSDPRMLEKPTGDVIILRIPRADIPRLSGIVILILPKCRRLNLSLLEIEDYTEEDISRYREQLDLIGGYLAKCYKAKQSVEVSCLTDRIVLRRMNNCDAGINHLTVAPDGQLYICPAFYYGGDVSVGHVDGGESIPNGRLLDIKNSPVCSLCDAFQCKRCVFLNKKLTLAVNIPSWQQCKIAHAERASSRVLLSMIDWPIPAIDYDDPFTLAKG